MAIINNEEIQKKEEELEAAEAKKAEEASKAAREVETTESGKKEEEQAGETQTPKEEEAKTEVEEKVEEKQPESPQAPMFTQEQVNELVGRARQEGRKSAAQELLKRYDELNDLFGKGQSYEVLNDDYQTQSGEFRRISAENALLKSKVPENRWEDVMLILTGKGLDITPDNIMAMTETHPEWLGGNINGNNNIVPPQERVAVPMPEMQQQSVEFNNRMLRPKAQSEVVPPDAGKVRAIGSTTKNPKAEEDSEAKDILKWMGAL